MRSAPTALVDLLNGLRAQSDSRVLMADCYTFTLLNGLVLTYTNADVPIVLDGYTYLADSILVDGLRFKCAAGLDVDQQQITISARPADTVSGVPFLQALREGVFDGCEIQRARAFLTSWVDAPLGSVVLFKGRVAAIDSVGRTSAQITVNSDLALLDINMPRNLYQPNCVHVLYDSGCSLVKEAYAASGTVGDGSSVSIIKWASASSAFSQGTLLFSSGINAGVSVNIKTADSTSLTLSYPLQTAPSPGDTFTAYQGCDHTMSTCKAKFANLANFRGFPFVPPPAAAY